MNVKKFKFVGEPSCKRFCVLNGYNGILFSVMESLRLGKLVPFRSLAFP